MKKTIITLSLVLVVKICLGQSYKAEYLEKMILSKKAIKEMSKYPDQIKNIILEKQKGEKKTLIFNKQKSIYAESTNAPLMNLISTDNELDGEREVKTEIISYRAKDTYYKDFQNNKFLIEKFISGEEYYVNGKIMQYKWKLLNDKQTIGGLNCKKAVAELLNGEKIVAWYADNISSTNGPAEYGGLPGIIVHLKAPRRSFELVTLNELEGKINLEIPTPNVIMTMKEYNEKFNPKNNIRKK